MMRGVIASGLVIAAVGLGATAPSAHVASGAANPCAVAHTRTLRENRYVRVYADPDRQGIRRKFDTVACSKTKRHAIALDAANLEYYVFLESIQLRGPILAAAEESGCAGDGLCSTGVVARDMRFSGTSREVINGDDAGPRHHRLVKIGSLRVNPKGALVWISCPEGPRSKLSGSPRPNCVHKGDSDRVYALGVARSARRILLDQGKTIDPSSLEVHDGVASWERGKTRRHATLP